MEACRFGFELKPQPNLCFVRELLSIHAVIKGKKAWEPFVVVFFPRRNLSEQ